MNKYFHKYFLAYIFCFLQIDRSPFSKYFPLNSVLENINISSNIFLWLLLEKYNPFANKTEKSFWTFFTSFRLICQIFLHLDVYSSIFSLISQKFSHLSVNYFPVDGILENTVSYFSPDDVFEKYAYIEKIPFDKRIPFEPKY